jgi:predicted nucleotidyltransferase
VPVAQQEVIDEVTRLLIDFYRPVRIYLFGSAARGEAGPDSDLDFCVVLPDDAPRNVYLDRSIRQRFWDLHAPIDIVRLPYRDLDARAAHVVASLPATILREGRLLYESRPPAAQ